MIAGENLYAGDYVYMDQKDGLVYQATWEEFKKGNVWKIPLDIRKGETLPRVATIPFSVIKKIP